MEVGLIGLGRSAAAVAHNLVVAGHQLTTFCPSTTGADPCAVAGAASARRVRDVCNADVVITMLPGDASVEEVVLGEGGVAHCMPAAAIHVCMSTIGMGLSRRLAAIHEDRVQRYVAAPVFGRAGDAAKGELYIFAGGRADTILRCQSLFDVLGRQTIKVAHDPAEANLLQLSTLGLVSSLVASLAEAMTLAAKGGIPKERFLQLMTQSVFARGFHAGYGALLAAQADELASATVEQGRRVVTLLMDGADAVGASMPLMRLLLDELNGLTAQGFNDRPWLEVALLPD